jgi:transcriptional regulator with XRE-family HTH domain
MDQVDIKNTYNGAGESAGARLRRARISKGYSLEDLAIATGLTESEISQIEDDNSGDGQHVGRIEHALGSLIEAKQG